MTTDDQIAAYISGHPAPKRADLQRLHDLMMQILPDGRRWFLNGKTPEGKVVSNPNIGYGTFAKPHAGGGTEFYQIGFSANTAGISVYIMTFPDRTYLPQTYAATLGRAKVTGYCITFRALTHIDIAVLAAALRDGAARP